MCLYSDLKHLKRLVKHETSEGKSHRLQVKVQDDVHVGGQGCEQGVEGPVRAHLGDDDGPQSERQRHVQQGQGPAMTCTLKHRFRLEKNHNNVLK